MAASDQGGAVVNPGPVLLAEGGAVCTGDSPAEAEELPDGPVPGVVAVVSCPGNGTTGAWLVGAGNGRLGDGLVAGTCGGGRSGSSATAVATPPPKARHAATAKPAIFRRRPRLARSAMYATGAAALWACPTRAACRNRDRNGSWCSVTGGLLHTRVL
ncbi:hypothetical protein GCM10010211_43040 [Streptomyces albospinus]|uniref:Uncharacterized protein n=1 Tax=Streptomyces albospinus TaxID=285515 RepID=A0ABQ2V9I2_9ACTN|nr:hypothetical protein [Streptomyces albospinus]GGU72604.1 hypothetical protein GCM10010211_43040 [Streptomyces albospinus]